MIKNLTGINVELTGPPFAVGTVVKIDGVDVSNILKAFSFRAGTDEQLNSVSIEYDKFSIADATPEQLEALEIEEAADDGDNPV